MVNLTGIGMDVLLAMAPAPQPGQPAPPMWTSLVPMLLLIAVFYFALIRPQQKKAKQHTELLKSIKPGDKVVTGGGLIATVVTVRERTVTIRSGDSKLEVTKGSIAEITERSGEAAQS